MKLSSLYSNLKKAIGDGGEYMIPNDHDKASVAVGLLNAEAGIMISDATKGLSHKIVEASDRIDLNIALQVGRIIESNEKLGKSNDDYVKWFKCLTVALIITTLFVGTLQAFVTWKNVEVSKIQQDNKCK